MALFDEHVVVVAPSREAVERREANRPKSAYGDGRLSGAELDDALRVETPRIGLWLDTSTQTPEATVDEIARRSGEAIVAPTQHRRIPLSPYLKGLREVIGSELILVPAVSTLVFDDDGRVLLVYEVDQDVWSTPGGSVNVDERPDDAARREVLEETGLEVRLDGIVTALGGPEFRTRYKNGDEVAYVCTVYRGAVIGGALQPDGDEATAAEWFPIVSLTTIPLSGFATALFRSLEWIP